MQSTVRAASCRTSCRVKSVASSSSSSSSSPVLSVLARGRGRRRRQSLCHQNSGVENVGALLHQRRQVLLLSSATNRYVCPDATACNSSSSSSQLGRVDRGCCASSSRGAIGRHCWRKKRSTVCRTESNAARSSSSGSDNIEAGQSGGTGGGGGGGVYEGDSLLLKDLLLHATQSRQRLHKRAARALSTIVTDSQSSGTPGRDKGASDKQKLDSLDFAHDNDYNAVNMEQGKQVLSGSLVYEVLTMDWKGATYRAYLKRRDLLRHYDLQPRDLRRIDPALADSFSSPCLSVRDNAILISLGGMRGIISANKAIIFEPDSRYTKKFVEIVSPRLAATSGMANLEDSTKLAGPGETAAESASKSSAETPELRAKYRQLDDKNLPFELECCEGALMVLVGQLDNELDTIEFRISKLLEKLPAKVNTENLEELRKVKSILVELENRSEQVTELLADFLEDEDDIAGMNLTSQLMKEEEQAKKGKKKPKSKKGKNAMGRASADSRYGSEKGQDNYVSADYVTIAVDDSEVENILEEAEEELEEVEDLIEYYLQRCTSIFNETETFLVGMRDMEESIGVVLSSRRFEVNRLELALSMGSFAASLGAMISGIFGMNMRNKFEMSVVGFYGTTAGILILCFCVFWFLYRYTRHKKIL